jgi:Ca2+-binding RTX toxin-like protein
MGKGGREMRRTALLLGAMLTALVALSGVAWAVTTIYCSDPQNVYGTICAGTSGDDEVIGRNKADHIFAGYGNDVVRAGKGADYIEGGIDLSRGKDVNYGGPGNDILEGHQDAERHYGGGGDDQIYDPRTGSPDRIRCGDGYDRVTYNKGVDMVAADCEVLYPETP